MGEKSDLHRHYVLELESELRELERREEASTRRIQMLVYPAMVAFVILAAYGFYLVHSLAEDVGRMANSITTISDSVGQNMNAISSSTVEMSDKMTSLVSSTESMSNRVGDMSKNLGVMQDSTTSMATSTNHMQQDMWSLNKSISTPLSMFNQFIPWSNNSNNQYQAPQQQRQIATPAYSQQLPVQQPNMQAAIQP